MGARRPIVNALRRVRRDQRGVTLPELIAVMAILLLVLTPLVSSFTSALRHEADQSEREAAYSSARQALQRMRTDLHCASGVTAVDQNIYGGFTLTLTQANDAGAGWCPAVIPQGSGSSGVQWCTIPYPGSTTRYRLYRFLGLNPTDCDGGEGSTFQIDYIAPPRSAGWPTNSTVLPAPTSWDGNLWPTPDTCPVDRLPTLTIHLNTSVDPDASPYRHYEIVDAIALRNADRCEAP